MHSSMTDASHAPQALPEAIQLPSDLQKHSVESQVWQESVEFVRDSPGLKVESPKEQFSGCTVSDAAVSVSSESPPLQPGAKRKMAPIAHKKATVRNSLFRSLNALAFMSSPLKNDDLRALQNTEPGPCPRMIN